MKKANTIFLTDDETGEEIEFEIIDAIEEEGERFILVVPIGQDQDADIEEEVAIILKDVSNNSEEAIYKIVEDNEEFSKVAAYFMGDNTDYDIEF